MILVELHNLLVFQSVKDRTVFPRKGAFQFMYWLKTKCQLGTGIRAAFYTQLPSVEAQSLAAVLDPDDVLYVYADEYNKKDSSGDSTSVMWDLHAIWNCSDTPGSGCCPYSTIVIDNNVRRSREYPNNLVYIPAFGEREVQGEDYFNFRQVQGYLDAVLQQWLQRSREKLAHRDIRSILQNHLEPSVRREARLLILLDLNGTLMYRSAEALRTKVAVHIGKEDRNKYYYFRPAAAGFVSFLIEQLDCSDSIDVAFYSSMTGKNARAAAAQLDTARRLHVYARNFNKRDLSGDNEFAVIRDLPAVWGAVDTPGFHHTARSTIMIDDTHRKLREFPDNLVHIPEYTADSIERGEGFNLSLLETHIKDIITSWQTNYSLDRDIRTQSYILLYVCSVTRAAPN